MVKDNVEENVRLPGRNRRTGGWISRFAEFEEGCYDGHLSGPTREKSAINSGSFALNSGFCSFSLEWAEVEQDLPVNGILT